MPPMRLMSPGRVSSGNGGEHLPVFLVGNSQPTTLNEATSPKKVQFLDEASVLLAKHGVASRINNELVKGKVEWVIGLEVALPRCLLHISEKPFQVQELIVCHPFGKQPASETE